MAEQQKIVTQRRYQVVVNRITKTRIYKDNLTELTKNINEKWSPHNKKALIFDALGFGYINFKTNVFDTKLMGVYKFNDIVPPDVVNAEIQRGRNPFKSTRPMINAVIEPYIMSNVEEIIFHKGNFADFPYDLQFELQGIQAFLNQKAKTHCVRLQWFIEVEQEFSYDLYQGYNPDKQSIRSFFEEKNVACKVYELQPEKNEAGYLTKYVLNSGNYKYDAKYDPNDKNCKGEEYSLSKYFYEYDMAAKKVLEEMQKPKEKKEGTKKTEEPVVYDAQVESAVKATLSKLETFYSPLWGKKYDAIFCDTGLKYTVSGRNIYNRNKSLVDAMYSAWKETSNVVNVADVESPKFTMKDDFSPGFHHSVLNDKVLWITGKDGQPAIKKQLYKKYLEKYNEYYSSKPEQLDILERNLTNCFVVKRWGKNDVLLRFTGIRPEQKEEFERVFSERLAATYRGGSMAGMIANCEISKEGIGTLTYIINWQEFLDEILFAYKQYTENGVKPSLTNALLGLKMDGSPLSINLVETGQMLTTILAGSRSGKGTLTMGLLASLFGAGGSIVYLDNKPDIGSMLWDLEREYANQGLKLLSLDVGKEMHEFTGSTPLRTGELNLLPNDAHQATAFRTLRLCKLFQLVTLLGKHSSEISKKLGITTDNLFFIIDELTSLNADYTTLELYVKEMSKKYKSIADKQKATDEDKALAKYYATLENMIIQMNIDLVQGLTKDWGMSGIRVILVGQELGAKWKVAGKGFNTSFAGLLMNSTHKTLAGRIQSNPNTYRFGKSGAKLAEQTGVFTYSQSAPSPIDAAGSSTLGLNITQLQKFQQFRSYFSLVKNDFNYEEFESEGAEDYVINHPKRFTTQLLSNYINKGEDAINRVVNELYDAEAGKNRDEISFSGLIKVMQEKAGVSDETLIANMNKGYQILDGLFKLLGLAQYNHLEEYLCDCSPEGVFTLAELKGILGLAGGTAPRKKVSESVDFEEELNFFNGSEQNENSQYQQTTQTAPKPKTQQAKSDQYQQQAAKPQPSTDEPEVTYRFKEPDRNTAYKFAKVLRDVHINVPDKMADMCDKGGVFNKLYVMQEVTALILKEIKSHFGSFNKVTQFKVTSEGYIIINDVAIAPQFNDYFIDRLPEEMQYNAREGYLADLFSMRAINKFKHLREFEIEDTGFATGRVQIELGLKSKSFTNLYDTFHNLQSIIIGGIPYVKGDVLQNFVEPRPRLKDLKNSMSAINNMKVNPDTLVGKVLQSRVVKTLVCSLGWTGGLTVAWGLAGLMGPWGLLFGILFGSKIVTDYKNSKPQQPQTITQQPQQNSGRGYNEGNKKSGNTGTSNQRQSNQKRNSTSKK
ncbi:hypothetical protein SAMN02745136_00509 [Anaerocolumna jejuensis DSM 15929]|uniref:Uncharacterized protein n=1 Tax=Anaerocolumna jejuensis DSM 15929 TaxID=1121322 RepID=A0A1M6KMK8_9FIRM|nr:hypothetical protein [Anaerocolumna jejuensis]SHJ60199.1 hypothetical protein SAMN02745136_00509 [Anaerocolumna jejuensis DSM 15929]